MARRMSKKKGNYALSWRYLKESEIYFLIIFIVFALSFIIGYIFPVFFVDLIKKIIEELLRKTEGMNFWQLLFFVLKNNVTTAFIGMILGLILGIIPLLLVIFNGYVLGFVAIKTASNSGLSSLLRLLPHGVFEIPALVISLGLGLKLARFIFAREKKKLLVYDLKNSLRVFLFVIIPLLIIAAIIETSLIFLLK